MKYYVIDAFTEELFKGNPAGVCILDKNLDNATMQKLLWKIIFRKQRLLKKMIKATIYAGLRLKKKSICADTQRLQALLLLTAL